MQVYTTHPDYDKNKRKWRLVRDIVNNDAMCHLRIVDPNDPVRSQQYKEDAVLTNFTRLTRDGLKGLVFRKATDIELPPELDYLTYDATGENLGLEALLCRTLSEVLETGRYGLMVDYPRSEPNLSSIDRENAGLYARIKPYKAENIINFKRRIIGSKYVLSLVVLVEYVDAVNSDPFCWTQSIQYRCLYLDENGVYTQVVYSQGQWDKEPKVVELPHQPTDYNGNVFREIPFVFIGSENNDPEFDSIPLFDLARINLGHYTNSADCEEASFVAGQPMLGINVGESDPIAFAEANPNGVKFGSRAGVTMANGGQLQLVQAAPNILPKELMIDKESQAISIGARFIPAPGTGRETAEGARIRLSSSNSSLYLITYNVSDGMSLACKWAALYQGGNPELVNIELNDEFYDEVADPNLVMAQIQLLDKGVIAMSDVREYGRRTGFIDENRTDAQIDAESTPLPVAPAVTPPTTVV